MKTKLLVITAMLWVSLIAGCAKETETPHAVYQYDSFSMLQNVTILHNGKNNGEEIKEWIEANPDKKIDALGATDYYDWSFYIIWSYR